jgi:hypothetical protein
MSETYTKTQIESHKWFISGVHGWPGDPPSVYQNGGGQRVDSSFTGTKNPFWKDQIRAVVSATTPADGVRRRVKYRAGSISGTWSVSPDPPPPHLPGNWYVRYNSGRFILAVAVGGTPSLNGPNSVSANNQAIAKLYDQLSSFESAAQAGEDLGEIKQTIKLLTSPLKSARDFTTRILSRHQRALSLSSVKGAAKALADTTLEYRFGVKPLTSTIANAVVGLQGRDYIGHYYPFSCTSKIVVFSTHSFGFEGAGNLILETVAKDKNTYSTRYHGVWAVQSGIDKRSVGDVLSLRFKDIIPTVYNLIPYSWLVDYFTNLGTIVSSLSVPWAGVRWCVRTDRNERVHRNESIRITPPVPMYNGSVQCWPGYTELTETSFSRSPILSLPIPNLEFKLPSGVQWQNIAALVTGKLLSIKRSTPDPSSARGRDLQSAFADEVGRRGLRVPYPFHSPS